LLNVGILGFSEFATRSSRILRTKTFNQTCRIGECCGPLWKRTDFPRAFELPVSTSRVDLEEQNTMFHSSPINHRIVQHTPAWSFRSIFECKSVIARFVPSSLIHPNAVARCTPNCVSPIQLEIHSSSESTLAPMIA